MKNLSRTFARHSSNRILFGSSLVVLSSVFYGSYGIWAKLMGDSFGPYMQAAIRAVLVALAMLPFALYGRQKWEPFRWREDKGWFALSALASLLTSAPLYYAYNRIGIGLTTLIMYASYLASMFAFGRLLNGERYTLEKLMTTALALMGLVCTFAPGSVHLAILPVMAALISGVAIGLNMAVSQKLRYNSSQTTIVAWGTGALVNVPIALLLHERIAGLHEPVQWGCLLVFVAVNIAASWSSIHGVKLIETGAAGILGLLEVAWGIVFGIVFFRERPELLAYVGAVFIIAAAAIPYVTELKKVKVEPVIIEETPA